jgi:eukaryotic-like serine/threonine-protein kinase
VHESARPFERADALAPILTELLAKQPEDRPDEAWLRSELSRIAGVATPPVEAAETRVVPVRSDPGSTTEPEPGPEPEPAADVDEQDTALSASVAVPPSAPADEEDAATATAAAPASTEPGSRRRWLPVAAVVALVAVLGLGMLLRGGGTETPDDTGAAAPVDTADEDPADEAGDADEPAADDGTAPSGEDAPDDDPGDDDPGADEPDGDADEATAGAETDVPEAEVPADWQVVDGPAYQVAVPGDWQVQQGQGRIIDHRDPDSSTYLRVDWTPDPRPDPVANWEELDRSLASRFDDYERIQLSEVTFRGQPAALLEYTYTAGGAQLRAYNLNILASDDRAYALNLQSQAEDWDEAEPMFASMVGGFQPDA